VEKTGPKYYSVVVRPGDILRQRVHSCNFQSIERTLREAVELAEEGAEHPALGEIVDEVDPGARRRDHDVGDGEVDDEVVGGRVHALVASDNEQDGRVADERQQNHDAVHRRLHRDIDSTPARC